MKQKHRWRGTGVGTSRAKKVRHRCTDKPILLVHRLFNILRLFWACGRENGSGNGELMADTVAATDTIGRVWSQQGRQLEDIEKARQPGWPNDRAESVTAEPALTAVRRGDHHRRLLFRSL
jgi:hypothetical protein